MVTPHLELEDGTVISTPRNTSRGWAFPKMPPWVLQSRFWFTWEGSRRGLTTTWECRAPGLTLQSREIFHRLLAARYPLDEY